MFIISDEKTVERRKEKSDPKAPFLYKTQKSVKKGAKNKKKYLPDL